MPAKKVRSKNYVNNPFFIAANGITLLFDLARGMAMLLVAVSLVSFFWNTPDYTKDGGSEFIHTVAGWSAVQWFSTVATFGIIALAFTLVAALLSGMSSYTSARIARGKKVSLREAYHEAFDRLWSYLWLQILMAVKLFLWTLLFIVPGVIMTFRYSLAGVAFFDRNVRGNAAIKKSIQLTRNGWVTTFGANMLFNILTLGALNNLVMTAVNATLYRQFSEAGDKKPQAHWLSWTVLGVIMGIIVLVSIVIAAVVVNFVISHKAL